MKNTFTWSVVSLVLLLAVLGCGSLNPFSDSSKPANTQIANTRNGSTTANKEKTLPEKAIDTAVGEETVGIPECDEVLNSLAELAKSPEDEGYIMRAARGVILNKVRTSLKQSIEENKNDKVELAQDCKDLKAEIDKYNADTNKK